MEKLVIHLEPAVNVPEITSVPLPQVLNLYDSTTVQQLVWLLVEEEVFANPDYLGALLFGSIASGRSRNNSDFDIVHIVRGNRSTAGSFRERLLRIFYAGYGVNVHDDDQLVWTIGQSAEDFAFLLDCYTKPLVPDIEVRRRVINELDFITKPRYIGKDVVRKFGKDDIHYLNLPAMRTFNYEEYLRKREEGRQNESLKWIMWSM